MSSSTLIVCRNSRSAGPLLVVESGTRRGMRVPLSQAAGAVVLGRDEDCTVPFDPELERIVSRRHAQVWCDGQGRVFLEDLNSANQTLLNGAPVKALVELSDGDSIRLGSTGPELRCQLSHLGTAEAPSPGPRRQERTEMVARASGEPLAERPLNVRSTGGRGRARVVALHSVDAADALPVAGASGQESPAALNGAGALGEPKQDSPRALRSRAAEQLGSPAGKVEAGTPLGNGSERLRHSSSVPVDEAQLRKASVVEQLLAARRGPGASDSPADARGQAEVAVRVRPPEAVREEAQEWQPSPGRFQQVLQQLDQHTGSSAQLLVVMLSVLLAGGFGSWLGSRATVEQVRETAAQTESMPVEAVDALKTSGVGAGAERILQRTGRTLTRQVLSGGRPSLAGATDALRQEAVDGMIRAEQAAEQSEDQR